MSQHNSNITARDVPELISEQFFERLRSDGVPGDIIERLKVVFQSEDGVKEGDVKDVLLKTD